jgi:hypothetical protein
MGIYGIDLPDSFLRPFPHFSRSRISPLPAHRQFLFASRARRQASGTKASLWKWRQKSGVAPVLGPVPDGVDVSQRRGPGKQAFVVIKFKQETQHVALPHQMRALLGDV